MPSPMARRRAAISVAFALAACLFEDDYEPRYLQANRVFAVPSGEVRVADWSVALARARCSFLERCNDADLVGGFYRNEPCVDYFRNFYVDILDLPALVEQGRVEWDAAAFGRCARDLAKRGCEEYRQPRACYEGRGTVSEGEACGSDAECGKDLYCRYDEQCAGSCQPTLPKGSSCRHAFQCQKGLECGGSEGQCGEQICGRCRPPPRRGMECNEGDSDRCGPSMKCEIWDGYDHTGSCKPHRPGWNAPGQVERDEICYSGHVCLDGTECRPVSVYDAGIAYAVTYCTDPIALGARCLRADEPALSACDLGSYCEADDNLEQGECVPRIEEGGDCTGADPHECIEGFACDRASLTCQRRRRGMQGERCETLNDCYSGNCRDGACSAARCP